LSKRPGGASRLDVFPEPNTTMPNKPLAATRTELRVAVGDIAPDFTLPDDQERSVTLSAFRGRTVVLFFYPKDNTAG